MITRRRFLVLSAALATSPAAALPVPVRWRGRALGAEAAITLHGPQDWARNVLRLAELELAAVERLFSLFDPTSSLARLNATGRLTEPDARFHHLMAMADRIHRATEGLFDPTVQPLWQALAEGGDTARARTLIGWSRIRRKATEIRLAPGQRLTLNGIAQGFATDLIIALLRDRGATQTLVNIGEFGALGGPWRIGVADPEHGVLATRTLIGTAIATSSPGALMLSDAETHILNPNGGTPCWSTVSVEAATATLADGLSTALCHADAATVRRIAACLPGIRRITLVSADGDLVTV